MLNLKINRREYSCQADPATPLVDVIRESLQLTGTKVGCREGECGACTVLLDGRPVNSCLIAAATAQGHDIVTIEGLQRNALAQAIMDSIAADGGSQCGFCTPGMVISAYALLSSGKKLSEEDVREGMAGNLCRCTGYDKIIRSVLHVQDVFRGR